MISSFVPLSFLERERDESPHGYIQFLSSEKPIEDSADFQFAEDILRLVFTLKLWYAWKDEHSFRDDFDFINSISQQTDNVDLLLEKIMKYLSETFNAGIRCSILLLTNRRMNH